AHFVNVGSSMMYAQSGLALYDVRSPLRAQGVYTASKIEAQSLVDRMPDPTTSGIPCIIAGEGRGGLFASLVQALTRWRPPACPGRGAPRIRLVPGQGGAACIFRVGERRATGRFNAAWSAPLSILEWIAGMADELRLPRLRRLSIPLWAIEPAAAVSRYRLLA